ncbi:MAG: 50S ribosomal protein L18e [Candidatus Aenigmarchaeota archaeon]|nr:50S ribosomal protein L18e [Candidatus Aenigmarchaeota archaeon]MCK5321771.1 50S ribosomal protein L18e [Candidatus Aenigmarchaeota archaeon]
MKKSGPTNPVTQDLIDNIEKLYKKDKAPFWKALLKHLGRSTRIRAEVNVGKLAKYAGKEILVVPGKVLAMGEVTKPFKVAALAYSDTAKAKLDASKVEAMSLDDFIRKSPKASGVKIIV